MRLIPNENSPANTNAMSGKALRNTWRPAVGKWLGCSDFHFRGLGVGVGGSLAPPGWSAPPPLQKGSNDGTPQNQPRNILGFNGGGKPGGGGGGCQTGQNRGGGG